VGLYDIIADRPADITNMNINSTFRRNIFIMPDLGGDLIFRKYFVGIGE
jgi:hypothetical protein